MSTNKKKKRSLKKKLRTAYLSSDVLSALVTWLLFLIYRWAVNDNIEISSEKIIDALYFLPPLIFYPLGCIFIHYLTGYYVNLHRKSVGTDILHTLISAVVIALFAAFTFIINDGLNSHMLFYKSTITLFCIQFASTVAPRMCITSYMRNAIKNGKETSNVAIVGCSNKGENIANEVTENLFGHKIVGYIRTKYDKKHHIKKTEIIGKIGEIAKLKTKYDIHSVIIANEENINEKKLFEIISQLYPHNLEIRFSPRIYEILAGTAQIDKLNLSPLVNITESSMPDWQMSIKRLLDILVSAASLLVTAPFILYFGIRIKLDSPGKIFYKQERIGQFGKPFQIIKLRTMHDNSENGTPMLSCATDSRVTKYGYFLRKYRIDEIPQFWNVLKGDMSLVGPRPERSYFIEKITQIAPYYCLIYKIKPGLTSWGPIKIGYSDTIEKMIDRLNYDMIYMDNMSLSTDLKILFYTIEVIVKGKGQ